jgi:hypothetical protein
MIEPVVEDLGERLRKLPVDANRFPLLARHLRFIYASRPGIYMDWSWNGIAAAVGVFDDELAGMVAGKATKAADYAAGFDEYWLIIHGVPGLSGLLSPLGA